MNKSLYKITLIVILISLMDMRCYGDYEIKKIYIENKTGQNALNEIMELYKKEHPDVEINLVKNLKNDGGNVSMDIKGAKLHEALMILCESMYWHMRIIGNTIVITDEKWPNEEARVFSVVKNFNFLGIHVTKETTPDELTKVVRALDDKVFGSINFSKLTDQGIFYLQAERKQINLIESMWVVSEAGYEVK